jgi:hypothetical protein
VRCLALIACGRLALGCVSTDPETPAIHPANPSLAGSPSSFDTAVLRPGFEPFERYEPAGSDAAAEPAGHEGHEGHAGHGAHAGHAASEPEPSEPEPSAPSAPEPSAVESSEPAPSATAPSATAPKAPPKPAPRAGGAAPAAVSYTCPMHPEIVRPGPGRCPKCGMKLVPKKAGRK